MTVKTNHIDTHGDVMTVYRKGDEIYIDGMFDDMDASPAWRGIYTPAQAQSIAMRLITLANIIEDK